MAPPCSSLWASSLTWASRTSLLSLTCSLLLPHLGVPPGLHPTLGLPWVSCGQEPQPLLFPPYRAARLGCPRSEWMAQGGPAHLPA